MNDTIAWVTNNPAVAAAVIWPILSAVVNLLLKQHTVDEWIEFADKSPRSAALIRLFRAAGLDPKKTLNALIVFINGKADRLNLPSQPRSSLRPPAAPPAAEAPVEKPNA
jgi:hypothetical protein